MEKPTRPLTLAKVRGHLLVQVTLAQTVLDGTPLTPEGKKELLTCPHLMMNKSPQRVSSNPTTLTRV